jgi:hypothetical protein
MNLYHSFGFYMFFFKIPDHFNLQLFLSPNRFQIRVEQRRRRCHHQGDEQRIEEGASLHRISKRL